MANKKPKRVYDVLVFGATGFTGRLIAEYLAAQTKEKDGQPTLRWAMAGRNKDKVEALKSDIAQRFEACASVGVVVADSNDWSTLVAMAQQTKVVIAAVGPFIKSGDQVVHACIAGEADYVDITGEPEFVDLVRERFDDKARDKGIRIVNCCGFDSIPHDLGALYTVKQLPQGVPMEVEGFVWSRGTFSGGTWRSAVTAMGRIREVRKQKAAAREAGDQSAKSNGSGRRVYAIKPRPRYHRKLGGWVFPLPTIDGSIVRRSARADERYGPEFGYAHYGLARKLSSVAGLAVGVGAVFALAQFGPTRNFLLDRKQSGDGPTAEERAKSKFEVKFVGQAGGRSVVTRVWGGDPGYGETSKMAAESALCLAFDRDRLPEASGILTPAQAMGEPLLERLQAAGIGFEVLDQS